MFSFRKLLETVNAVMLSSVKDNVHRAVVMTKPWRQFIRFTRSMHNSAQAAADF